MTVSTVSGAAAPAQPPAQDSAFRTAFQQLTSAIGSGDLKGAQSAYQTLTQLQQQSGKIGSNDPMSQFLASIGNDLNNGDMTTAQSDLTTFQQQRAAHHHHKPPANDNADAAQDPDASASSPAPGTGTLVDVSA